jgi:SAM-dependent methyltransferase
MNGKIKIDAEIRSLIPPLRPKFQNHLEASLRTNGCLYPLTLWGNILLDGHKRLALCQREKIPFKTEQVELPSRAAALLWVEENQLNRPDLSDDQRAAIAVRMLKRRQELEAPTASSPRANRTAKAYPNGSLRGSAGLSPNSRQVTEKASDQEGVAIEARVSKHRLRSALQLERADVELFRRVINGDKRLGAAREEVVARKRRAERRAIAATVKRLSPRVRCGDFRKVLADLPDNSVDLIFTDPPYDTESIPMYEELAKLGARVLVPDGSLVCYVGVHAMPSLFPLMTRHLTFWWQLCLRLEGAFPRQHGWRVHVHYKPLLWFVKGNYKGDYIVDVIESTWLAKHWHDWQQSESEAAHCISKLTPPDGMVLDPMCGSGTTLLAAKRLGRRFIGVDIDRGQAKVATARLRREKGQSP